jgi:hypothetical protein
MRQGQPQRLLEATFRMCEEVLKVNPMMTRADSFPDLGTIDDYDAERGCGHVLSILDQRLVFFRITQVPEIRLQRQMMSGQATYRAVSPV